VTSDSELRCRYGRHRYVARAKRIADSPIILRHSSTEQEGLATWPNFARLPTRFDNQCCCGCPRHLPDLGATEPDAEDVETPGRPASAAPVWLAAVLRRAWSAVLLFLEVIGLRAERRADYDGPYRSRSPALVRPGCWLIMTARDHPQMRPASSARRTSCCGGSRAGLLRAYPPTDGAGNAIPAMVSGADIAHPDSELAVCVAGTRADR
jgi:hypothetical protein